jgi:hypothetical protein
MKRNIAAIGIIIGALSLTMQAGATIVYSENFNAAGFLGSNLNLVGRDINSERWGPQTAYYTINNYDGWTFSTSGASMAVNTSTADQAVLLNENGGVANTVVGLTANAFYTLSFNYSGDNRPGQIYGLAVDANGGTVVSLSGLSWNTFTPAGHLETVQVQANGLGQVALKFYQTTPSGSEASPIIDNVTLSTVPEPTTMIAGALLLLPFGASTLRILRRRMA